MGATVSRADRALLLAAVLVVCSTYLLRAFRWRVILRPSSSSKISSLFAATTLGFAAIFLFGRAGEIVRPAVLTGYDRRIRPTVSFVTIAVERLCDMMAVASLFALNLLLITVPHGDEAGFAKVRLAGIAMISLTLAGFVFLIWFRHGSNRILSWLQQRDTSTGSTTHWLLSAAISFLKQLRSALAALSSLKELVSILVWTVILWAAIVLATWLVFRSFDLAFGLRETIFVMGWALVGSLVPTPGGAAGAFHAATANGLMLLSVTRSQAAAVSIILHLVMFSPAVLFGFYYFVTGSFTMDVLKRIRRPEVDSWEVAKIQDSKRSEAEIDSQEILAK